MGPMFWRKRVPLAIDRVVLPKGGECMPCFLRTRHVLVEQMREACSPHLGDKGETETGFAGGRQSARFPTRRRCSHEFLPAFVCVDVVGATNEREVMRASPMIRYTHSNVNQ